MEWQCIRCPLFFRTCSTWICCSLLCARKVLMTGNLLLQRRRCNLCCYLGVARAKYIGLVFSGGCPCCREEEHGARPELSQGRFCLHAILKLTAAEMRHCRMLHLYCGQEHDAKESGKRTAAEDTQLVVSFLGSVAAAAVRRRKRRSAPRQP